MSAYRKSARVDTEGEWTPALLKAHLEALIAERDERYGQRFDAQEKAVVAALAAQEKATATAFSAQEKATTTAMAAQEKAVTKAETAAEKRFEGVNEFRGQLSDQAATFVSRLEYGATVKGQDEKIAELKARADTSGGRSGGLGAGWGYLVGAVIAAVAIYGALRPH